MITPRLKTWMMSFTPLLLAIFIIAAGPSDSLTYERSHTHLNNENIVEIQNTKSFDKPGFLYDDETVKIPICFCNMMSITCICAN